MSLDLSRETFGRLVGEASRIAGDWYVRDEGAPITPPKSFGEIRRIFDQPLPEAGSSPEAILERVEREVFGNAVFSTSPNFYSLVTSCGNPYGILAQLLAAALNQVVAKAEVSPSATAVELQAVRWIAEFIGYPQDSGGLLVSSGSAANLTCLMAARRWKSPAGARDGLAAGAPLVAYTSTEAHLSVDKAIDVLGLGRSNLRKVAVDEGFRIDIEALRRRVELDRQEGLEPMTVIAQGGAVNTGAVDALENLADLCAEENLWLHVDGCYGAPAAATAAAGHLFKGLERADSVAVDAHKWFYVPFTAGCALVRDRPRLPAAFTVEADYSTSVDEAPDHVDLMNHGVQMSRDFAGLKVWMTILGYGAARLRTAIGENIETMRYLGRLITASPDFELLTPEVPLSVLCFRYRPPGQDLSEEELDRLNQEIVADSRRDDRIFVSGSRIRGRYGIRACNVKFRTERRHVESLIGVLRELAEIRSPVRPTAAASNSELGSKGEL